MDSDGEQYGRLVGFADDNGTLGTFDSDDPQYADFTAAEVATIESVWQFTVTSPERIQTLISAVVHVVANEITGDIVECGVWRGGSMMAAARTLRENGDTERTLWLYDTFAGMTAPDERDVSFEDVPAIEEFRRRRTGDNSSSWAAASLADVQSNMATTGYPDAQTRYIEGPVEKTIPTYLPEQIAILRLDTDWYASTLHELEHLYPLIASGGLLIIDDYGHWRGSQQATDEFLETFSPRPFLHRVDYSARLLTKP